ncbi:Camphene synthase [Streptomyces sp. NPDC052236]|uniref:terpene synthase family protein n=1 Tax=Streptomyces sp. NPDC052236 TaxID=3365686 RepID=UPI0037CEA298
MSGDERTGGPRPGVLPGPSGLGTAAARLFSPRPAPVRDDDGLDGPAPFRVDEPLGREITAMLLSWADSIGLYAGHLDYLEKCDFGRYVMLTHPNTDDRDRLLLAGQSMAALFALDDYYVDDVRAGATLDQVARRLSVAMSALDRPYLTERYDWDTERAMRADPVLVALRDYIDRTVQYATPQQVARVRHEDLALFVAMAQESNWRMRKEIAPVWEYLGSRQANSFTPCLTLIDIVDGYELSHDLYSHPPVRRAVKLAGLITVVVNDLHSTRKENGAGVHQFGVREAIAAEEDCSYQDAHALGVRLHNDLVAAFDAQCRDLMRFATPELALFLNGLEAWLAGNREWHRTSARYHGPQSDH